MTGDEHGKFRRGANFIQIHIGRDLHPARTKHHFAPRRKRVPGYAEAPE